jgi:hypothetical protein
MENPDLRRLPAALRVLCAGFLLTLGLAYAVALLFVFVQSEMKPKEQFRGNAGETAASGGGDPASSGPVEADQAAVGDAVPGVGREWTSRNQGMKFPKSLKDMILTTHLHMLSISVILLLVGAIFACSSFPERAMRFWSPRFSYGVFLFGLLQAMSMAIQIGAGLKDLLFRPRRIP